LWLLGTDFELDNVVAAAVEDAEEKTHHHHTFVLRNVGSFSFMVVVVVYVICS
jgi:signal transduction histidine kinase